jgi:hypothetical protein
MEVGLADHWKWDERTLWGAAMTGNEITPLLGEQGNKWFHECLGKAGAVKLLAHFVTQDNLAFCGPASAAMMLNALEIERPELPTHAPFRLYTQELLFREPPDGVPSRERVSRTGMTLEQFSRWFTARALRTRVHFADQGTVEDLRAALRAVTEAGGHQFLAVNYFRPSLGQAGGGHISPLAAMHEQSDQALLLDVARYRHPPVWVPIAMLFDAMKGTDPDSGRSRGFLTVSR